MGGGCSAAAFYKHMTKKTFITKISVFSGVFAILLAFTIVLNVLSLGQFDNIFEQYIGKLDDHLVGDTLGADTQYYKSDFNSVAELYAYEEELVAEIAQEGIVLLKNDGLLPLAKGTELSLFSHSSIDLVSGGSGSGSGSFELTKDLKVGLENAGLKVNDKLWSFYKSGAGSSYKRGVGVINYGQALDWSINECPLDKLTADNSLVSSFNGTTAVFVLSRTGGEGGDEARDMKAYGGEAGAHYLEPDARELEIINYLNENFENVILLVNCNNAVELGWVENYANIKAVVTFPGAGRTGTFGLGYVLTGLDSDGNELSPSGHLVDTFAYDAFSSPAMQNFGDYRYGDTRYYYVNYSEGIYVGYKYYETRYADYVTGRENVGEYDYASTVQYPFGYGSSYTEFEWSDFSLSEADASGNMTVSVKVRNVGARAGKEVVQLYAQVPYTAYDIANGVEKSAISLVNFAKTGLLAPNEEETVSFTVNASELVSYDEHVAKTYLLEAGDYHLTVADNAHTAVNNALAKRLADGDTSVLAERMIGAFNADMVGTYTVSEDKAYDTSFAGATITNAFTDTTVEDGKYLTRSNWAMMESFGLRYGAASNVDSGAEMGGKQFNHEITPELKAALDSQTSLNPAEGTAPKEYTFNAKNGLELIDLRGADYNDARWEKLIDQMSLKELAKLVAESGYCTPAVESIAKPKVTDLDGPAGLNQVVGHGSVDVGDGYLAMTWPTEYMLACSWESEYAFLMGDGIAEDGLYGGVVGWYGPGLNIHRTPFSGRNFEYYSEDPILSGIMGKEAVRGAAMKGMYAFVKHFALNDQETHRDHYGLVTWADEQTIREVYLKPFELCLRDNDIEIKYNEAITDEDGNITGYTAKTATMSAMTAVMSSFNRIGKTWAGGNYDLLTKILRKEWGFNGFILTDYEVNNYMHTRQSLAAGSDAKLTTVDWLNFSLEGDAEYQGYARDAAHHILYTVVNSAGMNGYVHGVKFVEGMAYYKIILIVWDVLAAAGLAALGYFGVSAYLKYRKDPE